jgi:probable HAF family extracellular repeat protein
MTRTEQAVVTRRTTLAVVAASLALTVPWNPPAGAAPTSPTEGGTPAPALAYQALDLGTLGGPSSYATGMNDHGVVVGDADTADGQRHGFLWRAGTMTDLGDFSPTDVNNADEVVGTRDGGAYLWARGRFTALGGNMTFPTAINDRRVVVGMTVVGSGRAVPGVWARGAVRTLPLLEVADINDRGQIAGEQVFGSGGPHASIWYRNRVADLGADESDLSRAVGINERGWVVGLTSSANGTERGALWRAGRRTDLGDLGGGYTHAVAVNDEGVVLVTSLPAGASAAHTALWQRGELTDVTAAGVSATDYPIDLNDRGEIAATRSGATGTDHAILYRPTP